MSAPETVWYGEGALASLARAGLTPASWLYSMGARAVGWRQERNQVTAALPTLSVGNITVGGTGKTPIAAWAAARLAGLGAAPAIVMRGYGDDEPLVHQRLNPAVKVVVDADRARGVVRARAEGADCAILDDAFQHRRISRIADWVLVSAEQWRSGLRVLPAGPLREPLGALERATAVVVTRKSASAERAADVLRALGRYVSADHTAQCRFDLGNLCTLDGSRQRPLATLAGAPVLAIAAVGAPQAFFSQLASAGARVHGVSFADHHAFDAADVLRLTRLATGVEAVVCTLKDAVKLAPLWTAAGMPLWYVSQHVVIEEGHSLLDHGLEAVLAARQAVSTTAGSAGNA